jgi:hypothetical protein
MSKISEKRIKELKKTHPKGALLRVPESEEGKFTDLFLKEMDRITYQAASAMFEKDALEASEMMLKTLTVEGDFNKVINDFEMFRSASDGLTEFISVKKSVLIR